ncbi:DUF4190 domain-containing protein [Halomonas sp. GXIMD04776]|uniref:DUF4190 domain-containing protein n=1 Tax=Halomonas sp. GXIMD04776 TaxID=3415605 RepID=UPI003CC585C0
MRASDGQRYLFSLIEWRGRGLPRPDIEVRFDVREGRAIQVFNRPEKQRRALYKVTTNGEQRHASWAITAIVTAMLGLFFDTLAPLMGAFAILFALLGLRQIRRSPQHYKGRGFCWAAIALALSVVTLSLLVEPATESRGPSTGHDRPSDGHTESHS